MLNHVTSTPIYLILPFLILLTLIALGPVLLEKFWHKNYKNISLSLGVLVALYYSRFLGSNDKVIHSFMEYLQFMSLLFGLYYVSGGIQVIINKQTSTLSNAIFLAIGAVLANIIGTTGASILLIRPFIAMNKDNIKAHHIVFFIFLVSNLGGALTPIGDPPLFLGYMKGVPFFWTLKNNFFPWLFANTLLISIFYFIDRQASVKYHNDTKQKNKNGEIKILGKQNLLFLLAMIASIFLDPSICEWLPYLNIDGHEYSFVREIILITLAIISHKTSSKEILTSNNFDSAPIKEVAFLFFGIFLTMIPAIDIISELAALDFIKNFINPSTIYWITGGCSAVLDNAPTYVNSLTASMTINNLSIKCCEEVLTFASTDKLENLLKSISISSVFFGAMTYIGNGPNLMVKSIAENLGVKMPSFTEYIFGYSLKYLFPILVLVWIIFI